MSNRLPLEVNPFRLIEQKRFLNGDLALSKLPRLQQMTTSDEGSVTVDISFDRSDTGQPMISGTLTAVIPLPCQRCLGSYDYKLEASLSVILIRSDAEARQLQDDSDIWLVEDDRIFLQDFIEDEILLSIPTIATHDECKLDKAAKLASFDEKMLKHAFANETASVEQVHKNSKQKEANKNPFALLKDWKNTE